MRLFRLVLCALFLQTVHSAATAQVTRPTLPTGQVIESVPCAGAPAQSYALYLPSTYSPQKRWPIIYAFDPDAEGKIPVSLYKDVAEKYGVILAASNTSRNFSRSESTIGAAAMWDDTHARFAIDERRTYAMGFSGGARMAGYVAAGCKPCQIAGVIADGAGYPSAGPPPANVLYFFAVGDRDFNWAEVIGIRREREEKGLPYRVQVFSGSHQWAPADVFEQAVEWMQLKAMQAGTIAPDQAFLQRLFQRMQAEAEDAVSHGDAIAELNAERMLVSDFSGLENVAQYEGKLTSLKTSSRLKEALKKEQEQIDLQKSLMSAISPDLAAVAKLQGEAQMDARGRVLDGMRNLKDQEAHAKSDDTRRVYARAFFGLWVQGIEMGQAEFETKRFPSAEYYFQLMGDVSDEPWPSLLLAETHTAEGNKKEAIKDLRKAMKRGLKHPDTLEQDRNLQALQSEPEFQKLVAELKGKPE